MSINISTVTYVRALIVTGSRPNFKNSRLTIGKTLTKQAYQMQL